MFARVRWNRATREAIGVIGSLLVMALGSMVVFAVAVSMAYADGTELNGAFGTPEAALGSTDPSQDAAVRMIDGSSTVGDHGAGPSEIKQQAAVPGVTVSRVSLVVREGDDVTYTIRLDTAPSDDVTVDISATTDTEFTVDPVALTFTAGNWSDPQDVTVSTEADTDDETDYRTLTHTATNGGYDMVMVDDVTVIVTEACDAIWCGIMDMAKTGSYQLELVGLNDTVFTHDGTDHQVTNSLLTTRVLPGDEAGPPFAIPERASLRVWLQGGLAGTGYYSNWTLYVNDVELPFSRARVVFDDLEGNDRLLFRWYAPGLNELFPTGHGEQGASWYLRIEDTGAPTPQVPGPPLYLRLASTDPTPNTLILLWNRPHTLDDYYHDLTEFKVQWKRSDGDWDTAADVSEAMVEPINQATHGYKIEGLDGGVEYDVRVIAVNEVGESEPSEVFTFEVMAAGS